MNILDALKTDTINKNVLLAVALVSLGFAGWMMASRKESLQQLQTLQVAHEGALLRIKELTDKLTEKDLEVEKVAKLSAEEAVKKIINIPELDKVLGIKATPAVSENSTSTPSNAAASDQVLQAPESVPQTTSNEMPSAENSASSSSPTSEKSVTDLATSTPLADPSSTQAVTAPQTLETEAASSSSSVPTESPSVPSETGSVGSSSSSTPESSNTP